MSTPNDVLRLTTIISELADTLDVLITTNAPNGVTSARQGKLALYDNGVTKELWVNVDGKVSWNRMDFGAYTPPTGFPAGGIIIWSGAIANIPTGWLLCNGANGTPDLRDKFVIGAGTTYAVAATGGAATKSISIAEANLPSHTHSAGTLTGGAHTHALEKQTGGGTTGNAYYATATTPYHAKDNRAYEGLTYTTDVSLRAASAGAVAVTDSTGAIGSGTAISQDVLNPYYALAYIMKS